MIFGLPTKESYDVHNNPNNSYNRPDKNERTVLKYCKLKLEAQGEQNCG